MSFFFLTRTFNNSQNHNLELSFCKKESVLLLPCAIVTIHFVLVGSSPYCLQLSMQVLSILILFNWKQQENVNHIMKQDLTTAV